MRLSSPSTARCQTGVTLPELLIAVAVVAILAALAAPSFNDAFERRRLVAAAEEVYSQVQYARSEAIRQSAPMFVRFTTGSAWAVGISETTGCNTALTDPADATACRISIDATNVLRRTSATDYTGATLTLSGLSGTELTIDPARGTVSGLTGTEGQVNLQSPGGMQMRVEVTRVGRSRLCTPNSVVGQPSC